MRAKHIYEDGVYLLNNVAVARNPLFNSPQLKWRFKDRCYKYLSPLCEIIALSNENNTWEMMVKVKQRFVIEEFYKEKYDCPDIPKHLIPETGYIFSQQMANLQSGFVKHFNWKNGRTGSLFYRRYEKYLVNNVEELKHHLDRIKNNRAKNPHKGYWAEGGCNEFDFGGLRSNVDSNIFAALEQKKSMQSDLEAWFEILPKLQITDPIPRYLRSIFRILHALSE